MNLIISLNEKKKAFFYSALWRNRFGKNRINNDKSTFYFSHSKNNATGWRNGYNYQEVVVIDDFDGYLDFKFLLKLVDRYPITLDTKGGMITFNSKFVIITSNEHPRYWYEYRNEDAYNSLLRRINLLVKFESNNIIFEIDRKETDEIPQHVLDKKEVYLNKIAEFKN